MMTMTAFVTASSSGRASLTRLVTSIDVLDGHAVPCRAMSCHTHPACLLFHRLIPVSFPPSHRCVRRMGPVSARRPPRPSTVSHPLSSARFPAPWPPPPLSLSLRHAARPSPWHRQRAPTRACVDGISSGTDALCITRTARHRRPPAPAGRPRSAGRRPPTERARCTAERESRHLGSTGGGERRVI